MLLLILSDKHYFGKKSYQWFVGYKKHDDEITLWKQYWF